MKDILVEKIPYTNPQKFLYLIYNIPYSFMINVNWSKKENYTIIGLAPFLIFKSKKENVEIIEGEIKKKFKGDPLGELQNILNRFYFDSNIFFLPGGFGYLSYDLGFQIENLFNKAEDDLKLPEIFICFYDKIFVFDNKKKISIFIIFNFEKDKFFRNKFANVKKFHKDLIEKSKTLRIRSMKFSIEKIKSNMNYSQYISSIKKIKDYIKEGDVYQVNFSHRFEIKGNFDPYHLFLKLQSVNPAPYSGFFNFDGFFIISNSPELFLKKEGLKIMTKPMKGTRKVTGNLKLDYNMKKELLSSEKDRAELIMITDMERNDLGKICEYGTVKVKKLINLEKYRTVYQTTSIVQGILRKGVNIKEIIKATFPGGSITGAPKKRAMEIIEELEPTKRNFYTGSMGYFGFNENLQLNILIRTLLLKNNTLYYPVGGGIVWDSIAEKEYEETLVKTRNLFLALGMKEDEIRDIII